jgi:hypothetical protein
MKQIIQNLISAITGFLSNLTTTDKSNLVAAINEIKAAGGGGTASRFGIEDNLGVQNREVDMGNHGFNLSNSSDVLFGKYPNNSFDGGGYSKFSQNGKSFDLNSCLSFNSAGSAGTYAELYADTRNNGTVSYFETDTQDSLGRSIFGGISILNVNGIDNVKSDSSYIVVDINAAYSDNNNGLSDNSARLRIQSGFGLDGAASILFQVGNGTFTTQAFLPFDSTKNVLNKILPLSVNGNFADATGNIKLSLQSYTVATLPASPTAGDQAMVTDATAPTYLGALTGGGSVVTPVFYNGTAWKSY